MRYGFIKEHRSCWPVVVMCRVLEVCRSGFYAFLRRTPSARQRRREQLTDQIIEIHRASRTSYGSPRIYRQLKESGESVSRKRVASIMRERKIQGKSARKRRPHTTDSEHDHPIAPNLLQRDFTASAPNQKWVADITYIETDEGWLYLAVVLDCFSRRVVGWAAADHLRSELVEEALTMAIEARRPKPSDGLIHHSDRGVQYASGSFQRLLDTHGIACSMSRKGDCYDNAVIESFFGTLKTELDEPLTTRASARLALFDYIEVFYNRQRLHSTLGYLSPAAFERKYQVA